MGFDLSGLLATRRGEGYGLHARYLNPQLARTLHAIGFDTVYERGEGAWLYDREGVAYLDMLAGFGVHGLGRDHPVVRRALHDALDSELADLVQLDCPLLAGLLGEALVARAPGMERAYFCNSGTEAVEAALKLARCATGRPRILYFEHAFHGLSAGSLSINGSEEFRKGFGPLLGDTAIALGDSEALERELARGDVAALCVEPIQGKGVYLPPPGWLAWAGAALGKHGALLICDEVQTGLGRTGKWFAYEHEEGVSPDLVCVSKALSGGYVPVGATLGKGWIFERTWSSMDRVVVHDSTFGGNALAMAAGLATLAVMEDEGLLANAARCGEALMAGLREVQERYELLGNVRGRGLMVGMEFAKPRSLRLRAGWNMLAAARQGLFAQMVVAPLYTRHHILTQVAGDHVDIIKLLPPLMIGEAEVGTFLAAFAAVMEEAHRGGGLMWDFGRTLVRQALSS